MWHILVARLSRRSKHIVRDDSLNNRFRFRPPPLPLRHTQRLSHRPGTQRRMDPQLLSLRGTPSYPIRKDAILLQPMLHLQLRPPQPLDRAKCLTPLEKHLIDRPHPRVHRETEPIWNVRSPTTRNIEVEFHNPYSVQQTRRCMLQEPAQPRPNFDIMLLPDLQPLIPEMPVYSKQRHRVPETGFLARHTIVEAVVLVAREGLDLFDVVRYQGGGGKCDDHVWGEGFAEAGFAKGDIERVDGGEGEEDEGEYVEAQFSWKRLEGWHVETGDQLEREPEPQCYETWPSPQMRRYSRDTKGAIVLIDTCLVVRMRATKVQTV